MEKQQFIDRFDKAPEKLDPTYVNRIVSECVVRLHNETQTCDTSLDFERTCKMSVAVMEEAAELVEAMSRRVRGRTEDNYGILEESADTILNVLCSCQLFGITAEDIMKAIHVKCEREERKHV